MLALDGQGVVTLANVPAERVLGCSGDALIGRALCDLLERRRRAVQLAIARVLRGEPITEVETTHLTAEGQLHMRWNMTALGPADYTPADETVGAACVLVIGYDVSEQNQRMTRGSDAAALDSVGKLARELAHSMRNPLNAARLQLELLRRSALRVASGGPTDELGNTVGAVRTELDRVSTFVEDFLELAQTRALTLRRELVSPIVEQACALEAQRARGQNVELSFDVDPSTSAVVDREAIVRALRQLIPNSIEALASQAAGHVHVRAERSAEGLTLFVTDDGPGIPAEVRETAMRAFATTKAGGTGLGLAIALKIVTQHGGQLELSDARGGGTEARLFIPEADADTDKKLA